MKLLLVDDDPLILEVTRLSLELAQWTAVTALGAREALELVQEEQPDAILMDVMMPEMDGPTACRKLAEDPATADIPVILLTAKVQQADLRQWQDLPIAGVLAKPFDPTRLADDIRAILGWS